MLLALLVSFVAGPACAQNVHFTVVASAGANGTISPSGTLTYQFGSTASFTATPNTGYVVASWSLDGSNVQTGGTYST